MPRSPSLSGTVLLGLLGCGSAAQQHYVPAIARLTDARLTAVYDTSPEPRQIVARSAPGCRAFDSVETLLRARIVDAAVIGGPLEHRASLAVSALGAGLPVLIEPPVAVSLAEADWIGEAERAVRALVMVGFQRWWWEPAERLRRALAGSPEGELTVESTVALDAPEADQFVALAGHFDLVRRVVDREIASVGGRRESPGEIQAQVTFHGGGRARVVARQAERAKERVAVRVGARAYGLRSGSGRIRPQAGAGRWTLDLVDAVVGAKARSGNTTRPYQDMLRAFVHRIQTRTGGGPGITDGIAALLAIAAVQRSIQEGGTEMLVPATPSNRAEPG